MNDLIKFIEAADETTLEWNGLLRVHDDDPEDGQRALFVCVDEDFERKGPVLFAIASGGNDLSHVAMSIHAFVDGKRITPTVSQLGDELIVTIQNA